MKRFFMVLLMLVVFVLTSCNKPDTISTTISNSNIETSTNPNTETTTKENSTYSKTSQPTTTPQTSTSSPVGDYDDGEEWKGTIF